MAYKETAQRWSPLKARYPVHSRHLPSPVALDFDSASKELGTENVSVAVGFEFHRSPGDRPRSL